MLEWVVLLALGPIALVVALLLCALALAAFGAAIGATMAYVNESLKFIFTRTATFPVFCVLCVPAIAWLLVHERIGGAPIIVACSSYSCTPDSPEAPMAGARKAPDGNFYLPDPSRPGKFLQVATKSANDPACAIVDQVTSGGIHWHIVQPGCPVVQPNLPVPNYTPAGGFSEAADPYAAKSGKDKQ